MKGEELADFADSVLDMVWNAGEKGISARELAEYGPPHLEDGESLVPH